MVMLHVGDWKQLSTIQEMKEKNAKANEASNAASAALAGISLPWCQTRPGKFIPWRASPRETDNRRGCAPPQATLAAKALMDKGADEARPLPLSPVAIRRGFPPLTVGRHDVDNSHAVTISLTEF